MSTLNYTNDRGYGQTLSDQTHYSQVVVIPSGRSTIKISGQGGWDSTGKILPTTSRENLEAQVGQAFANVDLVLKTAGSKGGWTDVYAARIYYVDWEAHDWATFGATERCLRKWCPEHRPILTAVKVAGLALEGMRIEIEVEALGL